MTSFPGFSPIALPSPTVSDFSEPGLFRNTGTAAFRSAFFADTAPSAAITAAAAFSPVILVSLDSSSRGRNIDFIGTPSALPSLEVLKAGVYNAFFTVTATAAAGAAFNEIFIALAVNGSVVPGTQATIPVIANAAVAVTATSPLKSVLALALNAGDNVSIVLVGVGAPIGGTPADIAGTFVINAAALTIES